jgi:pseudaminic acid synthase
MGIRIANREIGIDAPPFIIAEMSGNHNHKLERALQIVKVAAEAGADAIKLQTYTADTLTLNCDKADFKITDPKSLWHGYKLHDLYEKAHTPWAWHGEIFEYAKKLGIICFSSPFDETAVDFLEKLNAPAYKVASFESVHIPLIKYAASKGKPIIISTGLAQEDEVAEAVEAAKSTGNKQIILLKCTSNYPADPKDANLVTITDMQKRFGVMVGLSDHTLGTRVSAESIKYYGSVAIEKHVTLDENEGGVDEEFSLKPADLKKLVIDCREAWQHRTNDPQQNAKSDAHGVVLYGGMESEQASRIFRVSLYFKKPIKAGEVITSEHIRVARPGYGLKPKYLPEVLGQKATRNADFGDRVTWDMIESRKNASST